MSIDKDFTKKSADRVVYKKVRVCRKLDIDDKTIDRILKRMVKTFKQEKVNVDDPLVHCRNMIRAAINCTTIDGTKEWKRAPGKADEEDIVVFHKRMRTLGYDAEIDMITSNTKKYKFNKLAKQKVNSLLPDGSDDIDGRVKYGAGINQALTTEELREYNAFIKFLKKDFPKLSTVSDLLGMQTLAMLKIRMDRVHLELAKSSSAKLGKDAVEVSKLYKDTTENLGISGKQRRLEIDKHGAGSVAELAKRYQKTLQTLPEQEYKRYLEECHLFLNKFNRGEISDAEVRRHVNLDIPRIRALLHENEISLNAENTADE